MNHRMGSDVAVEESPPVPQPPPVEDQGHVTMVTTEPSRHGLLDFFDGCQGAEEQAPDVFARVIPQCNLNKHLTIQEIIYNFIDYSITLF